MLWLPRILLASLSFRKGQHSPEEFSTIYLSGLINQNELLKTLLTESSQTCTKKDVTCDII